MSQGKRELFFYDKYMRHQAKMNQTSLCEHFNIIEYILILMVLKCVIGYGVKMYSMVLKCSKIVA